MLKCIKCDATLRNIMEAEKGMQPLEGLAFQTYGHYGSAVFDPMDGSYLEIAVCDRCVDIAKVQGKVFESEPRRKEWDEEKIREMEDILERSLIKSLNTIETTEEKLLDKIDGLESDLSYAVEVAWSHGAQDFVKMNYPSQYERLWRNDQ